MSERSAAEAMREMAAKAVPDPLGFDAEYVRKLIRALPLPSQPEDSSARGVVVPTPEEVLEEYDHQIRQGGSADHIIVKTVQAFVKRLAAAPQQNAAPVSEQQRIYTKEDAEAMCALAIDGYKRARKFAAITRNSALYEAAKDLHDYLHANVPDIIDISMSSPLAEEGITRRLQTLHDVLKEPPSTRTTDEAGSLKVALVDLLGFARRRLATGFIPPQAARAMHLLAELGVPEYVTLYEQNRSAIDTAAAGGTSAERSERPTASPYDMNGPKEYPGE